MLNYGVYSKVKQDCMRISELATKSGLSKDTIRFYEKTGLFEGLPMKRLANNYRDYGPAVLHRLLVISDLKEFGFTLPDIAEMVMLYESDPNSCPENIPKMQARIEALDAKISRLTAFRQRLQTSLSDCVQDCGNTCGLDKALKGTPTFGSRA